MPDVSINPSSPVTAGALVSASNPLPVYIVPVSGFVDIRSFGASTDAEDNGPAIRAAIAWTNTYGGAVFVPSGIWNITSTVAGPQSWGTCLQVSTGTQIVGTRLGGVGSAGAASLASTLNCIADADGIAPASFARCNDVLLRDLRIVGNAALTTTSPNRTAGIRYAYGTGWQMENVCVNDFVTCVECDLQTGSGTNGQGTWIEPMLSQQSVYPNPLNGYPSFAVWSHGDGGQLQSQKVFGGSLYSQQQTQTANFTGDGVTTDFDIDLSGFSGRLLWSALGLSVRLNTVRQLLQAQYTLTDVTGGGSDAINGTYVTATVVAGSNTISVADATGLPTSYSVGTGVYPVTPLIQVLGYGIPPMSYVTAVSGTEVTIANAEGLAPWSSGIFRIFFGESNIAARAGATFVRANPPTSDKGKKIRVTFATPPANGASVSITFNDQWGGAGVYLENASDNLFQGAEVGGYNLGYVAAPTANGRNVFEPAYVQIMHRAVDDWAAASEIVTIPQSSQSTVNGVGAMGVDNATSTLNLKGFAPVEFTNNPLVCGDLVNCPWQQGTSFAGINDTITYTADQWFCWGGAASNMTVSKQGGGDAAGIQVQRLSTNSDTSEQFIAQILPQNIVRSLISPSIGQRLPLNISLSAVAGADYSGAGVNVSLVLGTGTNESSAALQAGTWTGQTTVATYTIALDSQRKQLPFIVTGDGTTWNEAAIIISSTPSGTAGAADTWRVLAIKIEQGFSPTAFAYDDPNQSLNRAREWWEQSYVPGTAAGTSTSAGASVMSLQTTSATAVARNERFLAKKVATPTITLYSTDGTSGKAFVSGGVGNVNATASAANAVGFVWTTAAISGALGNTVSQHWTASCRL